MESSLLLKVVFEASVTDQVYLKAFKFSDEVDVS